MTWNEVSRPVHPSEVVGNHQFAQDAEEWERRGLSSGPAVHRGAGYWEDQCRQRHFSHHAQWCLQ